MVFLDLLLEGHKVIPDLHERPSSDKTGHYWTPKSAVRVAEVLGVMSCNLEEAALRILSRAADLNSRAHEELAVKILRARSHSVAIISNENSNRAIVYEANDISLLPISYRTSSVGRIYRTDVTIDGTIIRGPY
jgi:hypothetical protein